MSDILEQRLDSAETKPDSLEKSLQPENDENEDPQISSATKVKNADRAENNETSNLEEKEETGEKSEISSKIKPASDETGAPISLPTSIPTPIFLKRKMSAKEAIDCTPKRMRFEFATCSAD